MSVRETTLVLDTEINFLIIFSLPLCATVQVYVTFGAAFLPA
jgi:hypothetical protein